MGRLLLQYVALLGTLCGLAYYLLCLWSARSFLRRPRPDSGFAPPVSILKPLRGTDPEAYESFRSHCLQDYPEYEIIFGVREEDDPAVPLVRRLIQEFPQRSIRLVICPATLGPNQKVSSLVQMFAHASHPYLLVNDSDIRVPPDYLRRVMAGFAEPRVGMVTCLYRGIAGRTLGSALEAVGINTEFFAGVLAARQVEGGIHFALGSTLAFRRQALEAIGGLEPLLDYLADDFELGQRIAAAGFEVFLSEVVVENYLPDYSFADFLYHQLRWARSTRDSRPWGYAGLILTFAVPWAALALLAAGAAAWSWEVLAAAVILRLAVAFAVGRLVLQDRRWPAYLALVPVRDLLALGVWLASYAGHTVRWRGDEFILEKGKLRPVADSVPAADAATPAP
jgi:ceramide glucosyltransferase